MHSLFMWATGDPSILPDTIRKNHSGLLHSKFCVQLADHMALNVNMQLFKKENGILKILFVPRLFL